MLFFWKTKKVADAATTEVPQDYWSIVRRQFAKNKLAVWSLRFFYGILFVALFADILANEKPLFCKIDGEIHFPVFRQYLVDMGIVRWEDKFILKRWHEHPYEMAIFAPITYSANGIDKKNLTAAGRGEFAPIMANDSPEGKAKNRRIEIILTPKLDEITKMLNEF